MTLKIVLKNILHKPLQTALSVVLMAFGVLIIQLILRFSSQFESSVSKNLKNIDLVVGAKGSPLQLILSGVLHIDSPTGNIALNELNNLRNNPLIKKLIPLSLGDNHRGFRIVGTSPQLIDHYGVVMKEGRLNATPFEVVIGNDVAKELGLALNSQFKSSHGLDSEGEEHEDHMFKVVGVMNRSQTVLDKLILCDLPTIWESHHQDTSTDLQVTCGLIQYRSKMGLMTIPRMINSQTNMMAASPAIEVNRLFQLLGVGLDILKYVAWAIVLLSLFSVFIVLYSAMNDRKYELALMMGLGASRYKVLTILILEGIVLVFIGAILGLILEKIVWYIAASKLDLGLIASSNSTFIGIQEIYLLLISLSLGFLASLIPSLGVYKIDVAKTLAKD
ncbi:MAG: ABC transporter permease [Leadbetterella sp.]